MSVYDFSGHPPVHYPPGTDGVMRYIAPRNRDGSRRSKCVTELELSMHKAAGRAVGFVFEDDTGNALKGAAQGNVDGQRAVAEMQTLGVPAGVAIAAAVDEGVTAAQLPTVAAYLDGFHRHSTAAGYRREVYGEFDVVVTMLRDGHVDLGWQAVAWSRRQKARGVRGVGLYQNGSQVVIDGTPCDVNDVWAPDWGQWSFSPPAPQPAPVPSTPIVTDYPEDHVKSIDIQIATDGQGDGYADLDVAASAVVSVISNTANPPDAGYKPVPDIARLNVGGKARVVVEHAVPNGKIDATVWVTG